ncbi:MAG: hypothetical protein K9N11_02545 [Lentisphaeria bacterium]|nr:hypothetical protein [Candidatus Neomarinimicrobiota bacterium]MCF7841709.1 hypothetical protein [Lentisphaeria bacterium]
MKKTKINKSNPTDQPANERKGPVMAEEKPQLNGLDKVAVLFKILGTPLAVSLFKDLKENDLLAIQQRTQSLGEVDFKTKRLVLEEFYFSFVSEKLKAEDKTEAKKHPFAFLNDLTELQLTYLLRQEPERSQAIILAQLPEDKQFHLIKSMSPEQRANVLVEMGKIEEIPFEAILDFASDLKNKARSIPSHAEYEKGGSAALAKLLGKLDTREQREFLDFINDEAPDLAEEVRKVHFTFDSVPLLPDSILRDVFNSVDLDVVALALKGQDKEFVDRIINNLPQKKQAMFEPREGPVARKLVESAQKQVVDQIVAMDHNPDNDFRLEDYLESDFIE